MGIKYVGPVAPFNFINIVVEGDEEVKYAEKKRRRWRRRVEIDLGIGKLSFGTL